MAATHGLDQGSESRLSLDDRERTRLRMIDCPPEVRAEFAREVSISVDGYRMGVAYIQNLIARSGRTDAPGGLWLLGDGGVGKTFILKAIFRAYPPTETRERRRCPVLSLSFSARPSESEILLTLLLQLGQNPALVSRFDNRTLRDRFYEAGAASGTLAILFDEAQHLWVRTAATRKRHEAMGGKLGDFLKELYDRSGMAFVFAGTTIIESVRVDDTQAGSRWNGSLRLNPFSYDDTFIGLLATLDSALPMRRLAGLDAKLRSRQLHEATRGNFRVLKNLISEAVFLAASEQCERIETRHLAEAYFRVFCAEASPFVGPA